MTITNAKVAYNGKIIRASDKSWCSVCECTIPTGQNIAAIAGEKKWMLVCKTCLQNLYMGVYGRH